jgi:hypothetical protein
VAATQGRFPATLISWVPPIHNFPKSTDCTKYTSMTACIGADDKKSCGWGYFWLRDPFAVDYILHNHWYNGQPIVPPSDTSVWKTHLCVRANLTALPSMPHAAFHLIPQQVNTNLSWVPPSGTWDCSGHGTCGFKNLSFPEISKCECVCDDGFYGKNCKTPIPKCSTFNNCSSCIQAPLVADCEFCSGTQQCQENGTKCAAAPLERNTW